MDERRATVSRKTKETEIELSLNLDGRGEVKADLAIPFFPHMLQQLVFHAKMDLNLSAAGDFQVDYHHCVEDVGICLGQALEKALGDKRSITRYGWAIVPFDEALVLAAVDLSGRPYCDFQVEFDADKVGDFDVELVEDFFRALASNAKMALHIRQLAGRNTHHNAEAAFKAVGRALAAAVALDTGRAEVPSTKGVL